MWYDKDIRLNIKRLEEQEESLRSKLRNDTIGDRKNLSFLSDPQMLLKNIHRLNPMGQPVLDKRKSWANSTDGVPIVSQLTYNSNIIVDLKPNLKNDDDFKATYGFSVKQMLTLAKLEYITLNLLAYDSTKHNGFADYLKFQGSEQDERAYVDLFLSDHGIRINSIRRKLFFDISLHNKSLNYDNLIEEGRVIFGRFSNFSSSTKQEVMQNPVFRSNSEAGWIESMAQQYAYNKSMVLITDVPEQTRKISDQISQVLSSNSKDIIKYGEFMRGIKVMIASPLLAPLGGTYSMSYSSIAATRKLMENFGADFIDHNKIDDELWDADSKIEFRSRIANAILKRKRVISDAAVSSPKFIPESKFDDYLEFLNAIEGHKETLSGLIKDLVALPDLTNDRMTKVEKYMLTQKDLFVHHEKFYRAASAAIQLSVPAVFAMLSSKLVKDQLEEEPFLVTSTGVVALLLIKALVTDAKIGKQLSKFYKQHNQVCLNVEGIKKLVG